MAGSRNDTLPSGKIIVREIPANVSREKIHTHFQRTRNGGGEVLYVALRKSENNGNQTAVVKFENPATVKSVLKNEHCFTKKNMRVNIEPNPTEIFESVSVFSSALGAARLGETDSTAIDDLLMDTGVHMVKHDTKFEFKGDWDQIVDFAENVETILDTENTTFKQEKRGKGDLRREHQSKSYDRDSGSPDKGKSDVWKQHRDSSSKNKALNNQYQDYTERHKRASRKDVVQPTQDELPNESTHHSGVKESVINFDKDIFEFLKLIQPQKIKRIFDQYNVSLKAGERDELTAEFHLPDGVGDINAGIDEFQTLYLDASDQSEQESYNLPNDFNEARLGKVTEVMKRYFPKVLITRNPRRSSILFIAQTERDCEGALEKFKKLMEFKTGSNTTTSRNGNYGDQRFAHTPKEKVLFEFMFPASRLKVLVVRGDIAKQVTSAIVNAANSELRNGGGVTGAIFNAGGRKFAEGCRLFMYSRHGLKLGIGEVVHTKACGDLQCENVLHVTGPVWYEVGFDDRAREVNCTKIMDDLCWKLIDYADFQLQATGIAIPAIGTGIYGVPRRIFCTAMLKAIVMYEKKLGKRANVHYLKEIRLVNFNDDEAKDIARYFKQWKNSMKDTEV